MSLKEVPITKRQAEMLVRAQAVAEQATQNLNLVAQTVMAGLELTGQIVSVDTDKLTLSIEEPEA